MSIIDVLGRSLLKLHDLQKRLQVADVTLVTLIGELTATKAALNELHNSTLSRPEHHYELVMDFEASLASCQLLVQVIDTKLSTLDSSRAEPSLMIRLRAVLADRETLEYLGRLSRIISALNIVKEGFLRYAKAKAKSHSLTKQAWQRC